MKNTVFSSILATSVLAGALFVAPAHAANQYVVIVADGLSPQVLDLGKNYLRKSDEDAEETTSFDALTANGKTANVTGNTVADLKGLLDTAEANGYKTGLVTTGDVTAIAPLFYNIQGDAAAALTGNALKYDFIAGGGRARLGEGAGAKVKAAGGTYLDTEEGIDGEISGHVLAPQADGDLAYAIDRDPDNQAGLSELSTLALDTLGADGKPFVLVIHDSLVKKALDTKDSPGLVEEFRELNSIVSDVSSRHDDNPDLKAAVLLTGGAAAPHFNTTVDAEQQNALFILSNLTLSFQGAGQKLKGADTDAITAFADPAEGQYKGWKVPGDVRSQIIAGTLDPEAALRTSYEPALKLDYTGTPAPATAYTLGFDAAGDLATSLKAAVAVPAK